MTIRNELYDRIEAAIALYDRLESALAGESAALEEVARLHDGYSDEEVIVALRCARQAGIAEERARWEARLERLRGAYAQAQKWNDRDKECDRRQERALAAAIDIMSGDGAGRDGQ